MLSDFTCSALQFANFWQDVISDYARGRIYLPLEDMERYGVDEAMIARHEPTAAFASFCATRSTMRAKCSPRACP